MRTVANHCLSQSACSYQPCLCHRAQLAGAADTNRFAVSERIGRFQIAVAGYYAFQVEDYRQSGVSVPPDGRRLEALTLGGVLAYDMPEHNASLKIKFLTTAIEHNADRRAWRLAGSENLENSRSPRQAGKSADGLRVLPTASGR